MASLDGPNLLDLPVELLEALVLSPDLSVPDVCALSRVCWTLHRVVSRIWAKIAKSRSVMIIQHIIPRTPCDLNMEDQLESLL